jgi:hypothetical protein
MQRISSRTTFIYKRLFPLLWFGSLTAFFITDLVAIKSGHHLPAALLLVPIAMAVVGYFMMKKLVFDLADEVFDDGDALLVRFGSEQERIALDNIMNVSYVTMMNPPRVTLSLRDSCRFGKDVSFSPPQAFWPWAKNPVIAGLVERIYAARRR